LINLKYFALRNRQAIIIKEGIIVVRLAKTNDTWVILNGPINPEITLSISPGQKNEK